MRRGAGYAGGDHIGGHGRPEGCGRDHQAVCSGRLNCKSGSAPEKKAVLPDSVGKGTFI